ncbi:MAG: head GIN domain-containing protein [Prolixibacteraceae bacterium]
MKTKLTTIFALIALLAGIQGVQAAEEKREVAAFSGISLRIPATVYISQGDKQAIEIVAKESALEQIITEVNDRELVIRFPGKSYVWKDFTPGKIEIFITVPEIDRLSVAGSGDIIGDGPVKSRIVDLTISGSGKLILGDLTAERVKVSISGSGDMELSGTGEAVDLGIIISGSGNFKGIGFAAEDVNVKIAGSGDATVHAVKSLKVRTAGSGDVNYKGNPAIDQSILGSGKVVEYSK